MTTQALSLTAAVALPSVAGVDRRAANAQTNRAPEPAKATAHPLPVEQVRPQPSLETTLRAVAVQLEAYLRSVDRSVEFSVDADSGTAVVRVKDGATGEVIRQIPNEEALRAIQRLNGGSGTLLDTVA